MLRAKKVVLLSILSSSNRAAALPTAATNNIGSVACTANVSGSMLSQSQHNRKIKLERNKVCDHLLLD